jgi:DNA-binding PadR family transcriptional regulator
MSLKYGLLGLLSYNKMTGYDLNRAFKDSIRFFWQAQTSQIYRELNAMEKIGWLRSEIVYQTDKPNKRVYEITEKGREKYTAWLGNTGDAVLEMLHIRSPFLLRIFFAGDMPAEKTVELLRSYRDKCRESLGEMTNVPESTEKYQRQIENPERAEFWKMTALFGKTFYEASETWADEMIGLLEEKEEQKNEHSGTQRKSQGRKKQHPKASPGLSRRNKPDGKRR